MNKNTTANRNYGFDNLKFILIYCVILGHMLEAANFKLCGELYKAIYVFHMPAFIFISGYFASFNRKRIFLNYLPLYIIFQTLYILYKSAFSTSEFTIQFTVPEWIMWYIWGLMLYSALLPVYNANTTPKRTMILLCAFCISFIAGFDKTIGIPLSLSRFFVFQPYFLMGYYYREEKGRLTEKFIKLFRDNTLVAWICLNIVALSLIIFCVYDKSITTLQCYGSHPYTSLNDMFARIKLCISAIVVIFALISNSKIIFNFKIPCISTIGRNTFPIYLFHGFIVRLDRYGVVNFPDNIIVYMLIAFCITLILGNSFISKYFKYCIPYEWLKKNKHIKLPRYPFGYRGK